MIKRIEKLERLGSFQGFRWPAQGLAEFSKFNLIYGWNYSGKTTLSRVFAAVGGQLLPTDWTAAKYRFELEDGTKLDDSTRSRAPRVEVFNRDYAGRAFNVGHAAPAQFVVGPENAELSRLRELQVSRRSTLEQRRIELAEQSARLTKELNTRLTSKAREISGGRQGRKFEKPQLETRLSEVRGAPTSHILGPDDLDGARRMCAASESDYKVLQSPNYAFPDVKTWVERVQRLLGRTASRDAIDQLTKHRELEGWVRSGVALHADKSECLFCEGPLPPERLARLQRHFTDAYENVLEEIQSEIATLELASLDPRLPDSETILPNCRTDYSAARLRLDQSLTAAKTLRGELVEQLGFKRLQMEQAMAVEFDVSACVDGPDAAARVAAVIGQHNERPDKLSAQIADATEKFERHHSARFLLDEDIQSKEAEIQALGRQIDRVNQICQRLSARIDRIDSRISSPAIGAVELNKILRCILSDSEISVADAGNGRFEFRRGGSPATEMSEGERTAVTFAYFVASLEADDRKIGETVVFVDDPICSLDSNHLYAVYALIVEKLSLARQLFVSTHSSELFSLLKKAWRDDKPFKGQNSLYYLSRDRSTKSSSQIEALPRLLAEYNSEYEFTFAQLLRLRDSTLDETVAYTVPNLLRKFLESYLGFRKPHVRAWSSKLDCLITDPAMRRRVQKFADDASHLQRPGRAMELPSYVPEAQACVAAVLDGLRELDPVHYESLVKAVEPPTGLPR